jgi:hypothetical protein
MIFFGVTRPGGNRSAVPLQRKATPLKILQLGGSSLAKFKGRIHNHGAAPHDYFSW